MELIKRSLRAILDADRKANSLINAGLEPSIEQDRLQECLMAFIQKDMTEEQVGQFINDMYIDKLSVDEMYNKFFK